MASHEAESMISRFYSVFEDIWIQKAKTEPIPLWSCQKESKLLRSHWLLSMTSVELSVGDPVWFRFLITTCRREKGSFVECSETAIFFIRMMMMKMIVAPTVDV
ncbi:hypothetical protein Csa_010469 [Cucumis sativus]|uniref:Uncharacterized protein n=1 Tax=Cucumis sativus TaxID=3659 RepID=A0A0A0L8P6_CUCSA|nr:hypothetical protein Csa_010469 [Cucumis sativus]